MIEQKKATDRTPAQDQQVGLAKEILQGESNGGKTNDGVQITPGNVYMARMLAEPKQSALSAKVKFLEPTPSGTVVVFVAGKENADYISSPLVNFCKNGTAILTTPIDFEGTQAYVGATKDGLVAFKAKKGWNIVKIMDKNFTKVEDPENTVILSDSQFDGLEQLDIIPISGLTVDAIFKKTLEESKANPFKFAQSVGVVEKADETQKGLSDTDQLKVLKLFQSNLPIESDFNYVVEGARGYNDFGRTDEGSLTQIQSIRERFETETDPLKKEACRVQLIICEKFLEEKRKLMPNLGNSGNWTKYLEDRRKFTNRTPVKFVVSQDYNKGFYENWKEANQKVQTALENKGDGYDPKLLEQLIIDRMVASNVVTYLANAKFDERLEPITR